MRVNNKIRVLVVDDFHHQWLQNNYKHLLGDFDISFAVDTEAAKMLLQDNKYNLVLTDLLFEEDYTSIKLERYKGVELIRWVREHLGNELKIIVLSNATSIEIEKNIIDAGADSFLHKESSEEDLAERINEVVMPVWPG